jgi:hypothetical protein
MTLMASFETEHEAPRVISERVRQHGPESVALIALVRVDTEDEDGAMETVAFGADLVALAPRLGTECQAHAALPYIPGLPRLRLSG